MKKRLIEFIDENKLSIFTRGESPRINKKILRTKDSKDVYDKVINRLSRNFVFPDTSKLWNFFSLGSDQKEILERQEFFKSLNFLDNFLLKNLLKPRPSWKPDYGVVVVTENDDTFSQLKNLDCPIKFLLNENDVSDLENYDVVQVLDCENFEVALESLPQTVFLSSIDEVYLERYLEKISSWKENFKILENIENEKIKILINEVKPSFELMESKKEVVKKDKIEELLEEVNFEIEEKIKGLTISGHSLFNMFSNGKLSPEIQDIVDVTLKKYNVPEEFVEAGIPVKIDEKEFEAYIKKQDAEKNSNFGSKLKNQSKLLQRVPRIIKELESEILIHDFIGGISKYLQNCNSFPEFSEELILDNSKNILLENPQPVSFHLTNGILCSILTGANSGGKTTLMEHILQLIVLFQMGLPVSGFVKLPLFSDIYYFAKNKGSADKGAFETLLNQMSMINPGNKTLILADEIESVTEPGVAGKIICATANYLINKNCCMIIATHLGYEVQKILPEKSRIDGIEAKGLNEKNELIVDHNPVLGRLAHSTPELIVERLAKTNEHEYFQFLYNYLKKINE